MTKNLSAIKSILYGDGGTFHYFDLVAGGLDIEIDPSPELVAQLAQETYNTDLLLILVTHMPRFDFEARKDVTQIFNNLLRRQIGSRWPTVEYLTAKHDVLFTTVKGYETLIYSVLIGCLHPCQI